MRKVFNEKKETNTLAIAALLCGIIGLLIAVIPIVGWFSLPLWVLAIVFGIMGRKKEVQKSLATSGLVIGILTFIYKIGFWVIVFALAPSPEEINSAVNQLEQEIQLEMEEEVSRAPIEPKLQEQYQVGDSIEVYDKVVQVTKIEKSNGSELDIPAEGHEYVIVTVKLENKGDQPILYSGSEFNMLNGKGELVEETYATLNMETSLSTGELAPNQTVEGTIIFEQPIDDQGLELQYQAELFSDEVLKISLQ